MDEHSYCDIWETKFKIEKQRLVFEEEKERWGFEHRVRKKEKSQMNKLLSIIGRVLTPVSADESIT